MNKRTKESGRHIIDVLFVLALFGFFAASSLILVTIGANVYKHTAANIDCHFTERTAYAYLTEKLRQNDTADGVSLGELEGVPALILTHKEEGAEFCTYLYLYDGYLKELYLRKNSFSGTNILSAGQNILSLDSFKITVLGNNLIRLTLNTGDGKLITLYASLKSDYS